MSLLDALLLDPAPFNIWIAARTDGIKGSGTASDPYDGGPVLAATKSITSVTRSGTLATATLSAGHGYQNGDSILMAGTAGNDGALYYNGYFTIQNVQSTSFQYLMSGTPGANATGTITAAKVTGTRLDAVLANLPSNSNVHLGAGLFFTQGYASGVGGGWQVKAGMKLDGAGLGVTTLRLFNHTSDARYFAIGFDILTTGKLNYCEVSDLTVDCNLAGAGASTAASAVRLMGDHVKVFRVKAINWGSKDAAKSISVIACVCATSNSGIPETNSSNAGLEDCIVVSPGAANVALCTALSVANSDEDVFASPETHGKAPFIRHCFVDCGVGTPDSNPTTAKYRGLAMSWCHGGVIVGNQIHNVDIGGPYIGGQRSTRDVIVRDNYYRNVARGPFWNLGTLATGAGTGTLNRSGTVGTVTGLSSFQSFEAGVRVRLITSTGEFSGVYLIQTKTPTSFTVVLPNSGAASVSVTSAQKVFGVNRAIVEGNNIELAAGVSGVRAIAVVDNNDSSPYVEPPDYVHEQVILRNNKIRYLDNAAPNDAAGQLVELKGVRNIVVQNNVLDTIATASMVHSRCANATYFNNRTPAGVLLRGLNNTTGAKTSELETDAEDAFVMAMFNER